MWRVSSVMLFYVTFVMVPKMMMMMMLYHGKGGNIHKM